MTVYVLIPDFVAEILSLQFPNICCVSYLRGDIMDIYDMLQFSEVLLYSPLILCGINLWNFNHTHLLKPLSETNFRVFVNQNN